jgi:hypothetical protein
VLPAVEVVVWPGAVEQIHPPVVKAVVVVVIDPREVGTDQAVHEETGLLSVTPDCRDGVRAVVPARTLDLPEIPAVLHDQLVVMVINQRYSSTCCLAMQRDRLQYDPSSFIMSQIIAGRSIN